MNQYIKFLLKLGVLSVSGLFVSAYAAEEYGMQDLNTLLNGAADTEGCEVEKVVFARGIQSYMLSDERKWIATGPLASLYEVNKEFIGTEKIGTHYQHLNKPAWEFPEGRGIVDSAATIEGAGENDVPWLDVDLVDEGLGYNRLFRVGTNSGVAPNKVLGYEVGATIGIGYTTFYVFLLCL